MKRATVALAIALLTAVLPAMAQNTANASRVPAQPNPVTQPDTAGGCQADTVNTPATETKTVSEEQWVPVAEVFGVLFVVVTFLLAISIPLGLLFWAVVLFRRAAQRIMEWRGQCATPVLATIEIIESYPEGAVCELKRAA